MRTSFNDKAVEAALAGVAGGGIAGAALLGFALGADIGDALAFLGALVGTAGAVLGAVWIERHNRRYRHTIDGTWVRYQVQRTISKTEEIIAELEKHSPRDSNVPTVMRALHADASLTRAFMEHAGQRGATFSFDQVVIFETCVEAADALLATIRKFDRWAGKTQKNFAHVKGAAEIFVRAMKAVSSSTDIEWDAAAAMIGHKLKQDAAPAPDR